LPQSPDAGLRAVIP